MDSKLGVQLILKKEREDNFSLRAPKKESPLSIFILAVYTSAVISSSPLAMVFFCVSRMSK